jgi:hypothetical protein
MHVPILLLLHKVITVRDITPPTIGAAGANATIDCPATPNFTAPTVSDACGATTLTFADVTAAGSCAGKLYRYQNMDSN